MTIANEDEDNDDQDSDNFLTKSLHNKKLKKNKKLIFKATSADLNSSSSSNTSSDGLSGSKPQYTLVNNGSGGGSGSGSGSSTSGATSNTTLMYRDPEDDDFVLTIASPTNTFKKKQQQHHQVTTTSVTSLKPPHPRFVYSPASLVLTAASNRLHSFENHRLNSAADSFDTAADTTIDDSKSSCGRSSTSNPDYELTNISQIKTESSLSTATSLANTTMNKYDVKMTTTPRSHLSEHSHSSAYGSISNSENIVSDTEIRNNINNNVSL